MRRSTRRPLVTHTESFTPAEVRDATALIAGVAFYNTGLLEVWWAAARKGLGISPGELLLSLSLWCFSEMGWSSYIAEIYGTPPPELLNDTPDDLRRLTLQSEPVNFFHSPGWTAKTDYAAAHLSLTYRTPRCEYLRRSYFSYLP